MVSLFARKLGISRRASDRCSTRIGSDLTGKYKLRLANSLINLTSSSMYTDLNVGKATYLFLITSFLLFVVFTKSNCGGFFCPKCGKKRSSARLMLGHLACAHFKKKIMTNNHLDQSSRACPVCEEQFTHLQYLVMHLAQKHDQLKGLVERESLVP